MRSDYLKYAFDNIINRKLRSWLTILSILIGISAIYALVSFGQGLSGFVDQLADEVGRDKLLLQSESSQAPGTDDKFFIERKDIDFLRRVNGIKETVGVYIKVVEVGYKDKIKFGFLSSLNQDKEKELIEEAFSLKLDQGRLLKKADKFKAVLGQNYKIPGKIFVQGVKIRDKIRVNGRIVDVIGFYETVGNPQDDSNVYMTEEAVEEIFPNIVDKFQFGILRAEKNVATADLAVIAAEKLRKFKGQEKGKEDFTIQTFQQAIAVFNTVIIVINSVLILIAFISLLVAGVNIMNTMYTSVLERTKEIGIMKSVGAKNVDILSIFLIEAGMLGLVGGILGIGLGYAIARLGGKIATESGYSILQPAFPWQLTLGCLVFAFIIGCSAGTLPAINAAKLKPVDALRYE